MDVQRYISSGIIESYVAGLATDQEVRELLAAMAQYPEVKAATDAAELDMERYVQMQAVPPPADLKDKLFQVLENDGTPEVGAPAGSAAAEEYPAFEEEPRPPVLVSGIWRYVAAAITIGLIISLYYNVTYYNSTNEWKGKYQALLTDRQTLVAQNEVFRTRLSKTEEMVDMLSSPAVKKVMLSTTRKDHPESKAIVFWNAKSQEVYLSVNNLPEPAADQQYQLWAIVNNKPIDAGVFDMGDAAKSFQKMKGITAAQYFAVTLEKKGGNPTPTLTAMHVIGRVSG